jgi:SAM domain (Sterile alpha motif)
MMGAKLPGTRSWTWSLRGVGLGQYATAFHDSGVDAEVLPDLTDADLEKLGVVLGHRKRLAQGHRRPEQPTADTASSAANPRRDLPYAARAVTFMPKAFSTLKKVESFGSPSGVSAL